MTDHFFKLLYFIFTTVWGYKIMKDDDYMPPSLGGSGNITMCLDKVYNPYGKHNPDLKYYILVTSGYHIAQLLIHLFKPHDKDAKNDFAEMLTHHLVTVYLYMGYYMLNVWEIGSVIAFIHDLSDIPVNIVKIMAETPYGNWTAMIFCVHMTIWFYTRCYVFPQIIYLEIYPSSLWEGKRLLMIFVYLLSCLQVLHYFWFGMFIMALRRFVKVGDTADPRAEIKKKN